MGVHPHLGEKPNSGSHFYQGAKPASTVYSQEQNKQTNKQEKPQGPVTCRACMLLMFLDIDGGWNSPFLLLLVSPSFLEFRSMARLNVYVLWGKRRGSE